MKKDQTKTHCKVMKGKARERAPEVVGIREPALVGTMPSVHARIVADYADLKKEFKKAG